MRKFMTIAALAASVFIPALAEDKKSADKGECTAGKASLKVSGLSCSACSTKASTALLKVEGVKSAEVCNVSKVAKIDFDPAKTSEKHLVAAIEKAGFKVVTDDKKEVKN